MVYVILLNWNGWRDTIECLESVLRLRYDQFRVVVCDNDSSDGSLDRISAWAHGGISAECSNRLLHNLTAPPVEKPIAMLRLEPGDSIKLQDTSERLILVQTGSNLGFAGGNNVGLRMALTDELLEFVWLLNNDTVVDPDALRHLVERMRADPDIGICGSTLLYYRDPDTIQALGGSDYNRWLAHIEIIGAGLPAKRTITRAAVESRMQYVAGASMLIRRELLTRVGLMEENYFLYFEELDLCTRARTLFKLGFAEDSLVYHKEGASIGTSTVKGYRPSPKALFYASRNRIVFTRIHYPLSLCTVIVSVAANAVTRLMTGRYKEFTHSLKGLIEGLSLKLR